MVLGVYKFRVLTRKFWTRILLNRETFLLKMKDTYDIKGKHKPIFLGLYSLDTSSLGVTISQWTLCFGLYYIYI